MKRILQLLPCLYFCLVSAWCQAQEPIVISFPETEVQPNSTFCLDVQASNLTNIEGIQFAVEWETQHLDFQHINVNNSGDTYIPNLNVDTDFAVQEGVLRFLWILRSSNDLASLPEKGTIFQICFQAGSLEAATSVQFSDKMDGEAVLHRANTITPVIGESTIINISNEATSSNDAQLSIGSKTVEKNEQFCVPILAKDFGKLQGLQFSLNWNEEQLLFKGVQYENNILNLSETNYNSDDSRFGLQWTDPTAQGVALPAETELFQICFEAIADENTQATIAFSTDIPFEAVNSDLGSFPVMLNDGIITITNDGGQTEVATFSIGNKEVAQGEQFCVPITAKGLENLAALEFAILWEEEFLSFEQLKMTEDNILGINLSNYLHEEGYFKLAWLEWDYLSFVEVPNDIVLFELCFEAVGVPEVQTEIEFSGNSIFTLASVIDNEVIDIPARTENGIINITNQTTEEESTLLITDAIVEPNEEFCLPILAQNMLPLAALQFELTWDTEKLQYNSIQLTEEDVLGLGFQNTDYSITEDAFRLAWFDRNAQNIELEQTQVLFELCFTALGENGEQTVIGFGDNVLLEATTIEDNVPAVFDVIASEGIVVFGGNENLVYPGDTDLNQETNHYDLINIGLGYGQTGPARENASLDYTPQVAADWAASTPITNINYKHADTNGNGIISSDDTEAIDLNWTNTPTLVNTIFTEDGVPFYVDSGVLRLLETNQLPIILGTETQMAEKIYSIAFSIYYESEVMLDNELTVTLENSWLGAEEELISVQRFFPEEKRIDVAISRIDQQGVTGFGELGALNIVMEDVILFQDENEVKFTIEHVETIGEVQTEPIGISTKPSIAQIQETSTAINNLLDEAITIYPNPATTAINISSEDTNIDRIELRNLLGKRVSTIYQANRLMIASLPTGTYFLTIHTNKGSITKKINIQ